MGMANYSQILSHRTFDLNDGDRYLIVGLFNEKSQVVTRTYSGKPIFSEDYKDAKTFKDLHSLGQCVVNIPHIQKYPYEIHQVKDLFEPRYYVKFNEKWVITEPNIKCKVDWFLIGSDSDNTYTDFVTAQKTLDKYKCNLMEYYYKNIMDIKRITLTELK